MPTGPRRLAQLVDSASAAALGDAMVSRSLALIEAPSSLGLRPPAPGRVPGVRHMPRVLREMGLMDALEPVRMVTLEEPPYAPEPEPGSGVRNLTAIAAFARALAAEVRAALDRQEWPLVIGGDCSILLGPTLALAGRGRHRLVHVDGHSDFAHAGNVGSPYPSVAGSALAIVTGRGPRELTELAGPAPAFPDHAVLQLGEKAEPGTPDWLDDFAATAITRLGARELSPASLPQALDRISRWIGQPPADPFWLHVDLDVLDPAALSAVDSPDPGGIGWSELTELLHLLGPHPQCAGMNVTIYDPELDPERHSARQIIALLQRALRRN